MPFTQAVTFAKFTCTVLTEQGMPLAGAMIRVLQGSVDKTAQLTARSPLVTDIAGRYSFVVGWIDHPTTGPLTPGTYTIQVVAPGFVAATQTTASDFTGAGAFSFVLTAASPSTPDIVPELATPYVSAMQPVEVEVGSVAPSAPWELIIATLTDEDGNVSRIEVPVSGGSALVNLQSRLRLNPNLHLVGDGDAAVMDMDFTKQFEVSFSSLTRSGSQAISATVAVNAANVNPTGTTNDLTNFTNLNDSGLADWLTPWRSSELPKYQGHYADALIWLPAPSPSTYQLITAYSDINRQALSTITTTLDNSLFAAGKAVRIRIPEPISGAYYAQLTIKLAGATKTHPLPIRYIHG